jgi:plasmid maintenance system killer protein
VAGRIQPAHRRRLRLILTALNTAQAPRDMGLPGLDLHPLKGDLAGFWSVSVSGNLAHHLPFRWNRRDGCRLRRLSLRNYDHAQSCAPAKSFASSAWNRSN